MTSVDPTMGAERVYFFLGMFWLVLGLGMLLVPVVDPRAGRFTILDTGISFGWLYNDFVIVRSLDEEQKQVFWQVACPLYNLLAYPVAVSLMVWLIYPLMPCRRNLLAGHAIPAEHLEKCRRRLVNLPALQVI